MRKYSKEIKAFIANNVIGKTTKELVVLVNAEFGELFTESKMKAYKTNHKLKSGIGSGIPAGRPTKLYPAEIQKFITENHSSVGPKDMAELLNQTFGTDYTHQQMKSYYGNHKLDSGLKGYYSKGHKPWNKGMKGIVTGGKETQFKKGNKPHNWVPIGSERVTKDGYVQIKIQEGKFQKNWKGKHILIWEEANGSVPDGHAVIFGDGNSRNFNPENLILVSQKQLLTLNRKGLIQKDADLTRTAVVIADLYHKITEVRKG